MKFHSVFCLYFSILTLPFISSCSLNYLNSDSSESSVPEFIFRNAALIKVENGKKTVNMSAKTVEQYKDNGSTFAENAAFKTYDKNENLETSGSCDLISANTEKKLYTLYGNIRLNLLSQKTEITADTIKFDKNSEQITSSYDGEVRVKKDGLEISGTGFSASGVSNSFTFANEISGSIITEDEKQ